MRNKKALVAAGLATTMIAVNTAQAAAAVGLNTDTDAKEQDREDAADATGNGTPNEDGNYNIVFITVDQQHYFDEYPEGTDYKARKLLEEMGTTFEKHYACSNMSTSSRAVMFTGEHVVQNGMHDNTDYFWQGALDENIDTIGDRMKQAGYYTALKGKWHMGNSSTLDNSDEEELTSLEDYGFSDWGGKDYIGKVHEGNEIDPKIVSESVEWLSGKGKELNDSGKSFFLTVDLINPHDIMDYNNIGYDSKVMELAGAPDDELYDKTYDDPAPSSWDFDLEAEDVPESLSVFRSNWAISSGYDSTEEEWKDYQDYYYNCIQDSDNNLYDLLTYMDENGFFDNTIIVFTADHGEMHGSHALKSKGGFLYENNIHVPLTIVHPDFEGGKRVSAVTSHMDLAPTFIDLTNIPSDEKEKAMEGLNGKSLVPLLDGSKKSVRDASLFCFEMLSQCALIYHLDEDGNLIYEFDPTVRGMVRGIVTEDYKFARYFAPNDYNTPKTMEDLLEHNDVQLFSLKDDPEELVNLAADPEKNADLILEMNDLLNQQIENEVGEDSGEYMVDILKALEERIEDLNAAVAAQTASADEAQASSSEEKTASDEAEKESSDEQISNIMEILRSLYEALQNLFEGQ
ncbi:MAG: sulfatase-like hydrolase/transferase [Lachnospiraceae bacterium]|nr:sulfatase-like hydrolase/transferase [Lachnospiraceae bacterium]